VKGYHLKEGFIMKTLSIKTNIPPDRKLLVDMPKDIPIGPAEIVLVISSEKEASKVQKGMTARELLNSPIFGAWKDRKDITDSLEYARKLRLDAERRSNG
jgi:hypothetical protein